MNAFKWVQRQNAKSEILKLPILTGKKWNYVLNVSITNKKYCLATSYMYNFSSPKQLFSHSRTFGVDSNSFSKNK